MIARRSLAFGAGLVALGALLGPGCIVYTDELIGDDDANPASGGDGGDGPESGGRSNTGGTETGGEGGATGGSEPGDGGSPSGGGGGVDRELIDDMEDDEPTLNGDDGRNGRWNVYNDGSGTQVPAENFTNMHDVSADPPHGESLYSAYTQGSGFTGFGAVLNVSMKAGASFSEYDASAYSGVAFWAKVGAGITPRNVVVRLVTSDTDPTGGVCVAPPDNLPEDIPCFDHYKRGVTLSETWAFYEVNFDDFSRGSPATTLKKDGLYAIEFLSEQDAGFELWIDDLYFIVAE